MLFSFHHYTHERDLLIHNAEAQLLRIGEGLKGSADVFLKKGNFPGLQELIEQRALGSDIEHIALFTNPGLVSAYNKKEWIGKKLSEVHPETFSKTDIAAIQKAIASGYSVYFDPQDVRYCMVMPIGSGNGMGAMYISLDIKSVKSEITQKVVESLIIAVLVSLLIGVSIYFLFHSLYTRRIKEASSAAVELAAGDMTGRAEKKGADEIGYLATSFNALGAEIANWRNHWEKIAAGQVKELSALYEVADTISKSLDLHEVLSNVLDWMLGNPETGKGAVVLLD